jgi:hypothetical protein
MKLGSWYYGWSKWHYKDTENIEIDYHDSESEEESDRRANESMEVSQAKDDLIFLLLKIGNDLGRKI